MLSVNLKELTKRKSPITPPEYAIVETRKRWNNCHITGLVTCFYLCSGILNAILCTNEDNIQYFLISLWNCKKGLVPR